MCKVMESIIHKHITEYCDKNKTLTHEQHGFRSKHSTTSNLLELINELTSLMDIGHSVDVKVYINTGRANHLLRCKAPM